MAGFDYSAGRSNNMVAAEERGMITLGRWAKRHGVSAAAAKHVMHPSEAHHTGTGRRGKSRLTYVLPAALEPSESELASMRAWDVQAREQRAADAERVVRGWYTAWRVEYGQYGRKRNVPVVGLYSGPADRAPRGLTEMTEPEYAEAEPLLGRALKPWATSWREVRSD